MPQNYGALERVLRMGEGRRLKKLAEQAAYVTTLEPDFESLTDEALAAKTVEFKERIANGEDVDELVFEAFAAVREAAKRAIGLRPFDVQLMGAMVLHEKCRLGNQNWQLCGWMGIPHAGGPFPHP